jgi:adenylylsulfate reductase subunit B
MSIEINTGLCTSCGKCGEVCPGSLLCISNRKAHIPSPERCWGCASCVKECPVQAISLYLHADIGGAGGRLTVKKEGALLHWKVTKPDGTAETITLDSLLSNKY